MPSIKPADLIHQANDLAARGKTAAPTRIGLRRAISDTYYALYHSITTRVTLYILPQGTRDTSYEFIRHFKHEGIRQVCNWITTPQLNQLPENTRACATVMRSCPDLVTVANAFKELLQARHSADYDHGAKLTKQETLALIDLAEAAIAKLTTISTVDPITEKLDPAFELFAAHITLRAQMRQG